MYERHKYSDKSERIAEIGDPVYSKKHDGANYFIPVDDSGRLRFISRRPSVTGAWLDRTEKLPQFHGITLPEFAGNIYNVELIHTGTDPGGLDNHPTVSGILNSLPPRAISTQESSGPLRAKVFDVIHPNFPTYADKLAHMKQLVDRVGNTSIFSMPEMVFTHEEGLALTRRLKDEGQEGIIVTSLSKPESENPRYKIKHFNTYNLVVSRIMQEFDIKGQPKDQMGAVEVIDATGRVVGEVSGFKRVDKIDAYLHPERWIGRRIQVTAYPPTAHKLRSAQYNGDADGDVDTV